MYKYLRRVLSIADSVGEVTNVYVGDFARDYEVVKVDGYTPEGKKFGMELTITKEVTKDGT